ncbi:MAG: phage tail assembly chaperone [Hyphomonas sp.]|jgi:hypothetical protein
MLPWADMLRAALAAGIRPEAFWRLSLCEWRWLTADGQAPLRRDMQRLMAIHPDTNETGESG